MSNQAKFDELMRTIVRPGDVVWKMPYAPAPPKKETRRYFLGVDHSARPILPSPAYAKLESRP